MKRFIVPILTILAITGIIFSGCAAPSPTPAPAPAPAPVPAPALKPAPAPAPAPAPSPAAKPIELRYTYQTPPAATTTRDFHTPWSKQIEAATKGRVKVVEYAAETLAKATETVRAVTGGVADIGWQTIGAFPGMFPLTTVATLPFLNLPGGKVDGKPYSGGKINSRIFQELYQNIPEFQKEFAGLKILFLYTSDPYHFGSRKPVRNLNDLKGMKIRELGGYGTEMWKLLGASPMHITGPDIYEAAQKGIVDGIGLAWAFNSTFKIYEVFHYWTDVATNLATFFLIMNLDKWNSLTPELQQQLMSVSVMNGAEFAGEVHFGPAIIKETLAKIEKEGKKWERVELDPGEYERWKEIAGKPLWDKWVSEMEAKGLPGKKVLAEYQRLIEKYR